MINKEDLPSHVRARTKFLTIYILYSLLLFIDITNIRITLFITINNT
jgi:hypothetical protein